MYPVPASDPQTLLRIKIAQGASENLNAQLTPHNNQITMSGGKS